MVFKLRSLKKLRETTLHREVYSFSSYQLLFTENQDGDVGRHTAPPRTTRTDRKSNGKEVGHQVDKK